MPVREPRIDSPRAALALRNLVVLAWVLGFAGSATAIVSVGAPEALWRPAAALLTVSLVIGLTHRAGGHLRIWTTIVGVVSLGAAALQTNALLVSAAAVTAVLGAVWAVLITRPADTLTGVLREYGIALVVAVSGAVGVAAWNAPVNFQRFSIVVIAAALTVVIAIVWGLGAGLHGLGRVHLAVLVGVAAFLLLVIAYSGFVRSHGSQSIVDLIDSSVIWMRQTIGGVPRPVEIFIGFPALVVGVSMRSQRREGWWVLVLAVIGTGVMTTSLVSPGAYPTYIGLSTVYSAVLGLLVGLVVRHLAVTPSSSRAARIVQPTVRVEPPRLSGLK